MIQLMRTKVMDSKMDVEKTWMLINKLNEKVHQLLRNRVGQIFQEDRTLLDTNSLKTRTQVPVAL
jgi:ABC-type ATPase involved in cell division